MLQQFELKKDPCIDAKRAFGFGSCQGDDRSSADMRCDPAAGLLDFSACDHAFMLIGGWSSTHRTKAKHRLQPGIQIHAQWLVYHLVIFVSRRGNKQDTSHFQPLAINMFDKTSAMEENGGWHFWGSSDRFLLNFATWSLCLLLRGCSLPGVAGRVCGAVRRAGGPRRSHSSRARIPAEPRRAASL